MAKNETTAASGGKPKAAEQTTAPAIQEKAVMYIGPNIVKYGLRQNAVYRGGVPETQTKELLKLHPSARQLFVSLSDISKAKLEAGKKGTPLYAAYHEIEGR